MILNIVIEDNQEHESGKRWIIPISKIVVWASGFQQNKKVKIEESVQKLGGTFRLDFTSNVTVLITMDCKSEKYKIARKTGIYTVTSDWLKESLNYNYFVNPNDYLFPLFKQHKFYLYNCDTIELESTIRKYQGEIVVEAHPSISKDLNIVIPHEDIENSISKLEFELSFFMEMFKKNELNLITVPWIDAYINKNYDSLDSYKIQYNDYKDKLKESEKKHMPKVIPKVEDSKRTNQQELTAKQYAKYPTVNIDECIEKLRKEPDFRKNMFMMDVNAWIISKYKTTKINTLLFLLSCFIIEIWLNT